MTDKLKKPTSDQIRNQKIREIQATASLESDADNSPFKRLDDVQERLRRFYSIKNMDVIKSFDNAEAKLTVEILGLSKSIQSICEEDSDLALGSIMLENAELYSIKHTIHTAIVCEIIAKYLGWATTDRLLLLAATLTMNIAMIEIQDNLYYQEEPLSLEQKSIIKEHPKKGVELLVRNNVNNKVWLNIVAQHHESVDGSGYPHGLKGDEISLSAQMLFLADMFCAKIVGRDYRKPLLPNQAMKSVFLGGSSKIEGELAMMFVKVLGIYPPGSIVRLANREIAVVTHRGEKVNEPLVVSIVKSDGFLSPSPMQRNCSDPLFAVKEVIPWADAKININRYQVWGYGIYKKAAAVKKDAVRQIRNERRLLTTIPTIILRSGDTVPSKGIIVDITTKGCLLKLHKVFYKADPINSRLLISFKLLDKIVRNMPCEIKSVKEDADYMLLGMQILDIAPENFEIINGYIESLRKKQA